MTPLTVPEAAERLRCHERTVRRAIALGRIPALWFGGKWLIEEADLPAALPARRKPPVKQRTAARHDSATSLVRDMDDAR